MRTEGGVEADCVTAAVEVIGGEKIDCRLGSQRDHWKLGYLCLSGSLLRRGEV